MLSAGMMIGPASNFILSQISVSTPLGELDKLNSPGLVMALSWALYSLVVASLYTDLDTIEDETRILREMEDEDRQMSVQQRYSALEDEPLLRSTEVNSPRDQRMTSDIREIQSEDLSQYNASPSNPVKLSDVPGCQSCKSYGSLDTGATSRRAGHSKRALRSLSTTSRKSDILFGDAERMMGESSSSESERGDSELDDTENLIDNADLGCDNNNTSDGSDHSAPALTTRDYVRDKEIYKGESKTDNYQTKP